LPTAVRSEVAQDVFIMNAPLPIVLIAVALVGVAQADGLPKSPACSTALKALQEAEDALAAARATESPILKPDVQRRDAVAARLQPMRKRVADACLGGLTTSPLPSQRTWATQSPTSQAQSPAQMRASPRPLGSEPLLRLEAPVTVTHCSGATCTASDGSTLTRVGPNLVGPLGSCRVEGVFLRCP
jgi:hypothetical protein